MKLFFISFLFFFCISCSNKPISESPAGGIKNTASFINYFNAIDNMTSFKKVKDSIYQTATDIKKSTALAADKKSTLKAYYDDVQKTTESMYNKIVEDLLNKEKRKEIKDNVSGYIQSLNVQFENIKAKGLAFTNKYQELVGPSKGFFLGWLLKAFILPIVKDFIKEALDELVRNQLDKHLKPMLVLKPWDNL